MCHRLFALSRMVEVLLYNLSRLHDLWPLLLDHIVELLSDNRAPARLAAIEALSRALVGALADCLRPHRQVQHTYKTKSDVDYDVSACTHPPIGAHSMPMLA